MGKAKQAKRQWARDEDKEQFWRNALIEYESSGVSISAFCRQKNISPTSFNAWRRELQIRERERATAGSCAGESQLPIFPDKVKDSRGRIIPSRLSKWVTDKKAEAVNSAVKAPFIPLRLVEPSIQTPEAAAQPENRSEIEVLSPTGFVVRLKGAVDVESVKRIFTALEK